MMKLLLLLSLLITCSLSAEPWGKDSDLSYPRYEEESLPAASIITPLQWIGHKLIEFHQKVISPVDGIRCQFKPSCSQYMKDAISKYGFFEGVMRGCDRLMRDNKDPCHYETIEYEGNAYKWDPLH